MNKINIAKKKLEMKKVAVAAEEMELKILEKEAEIERLNEQIIIQKSRVKELKEEIKSLEGGQENE